MTQFGIGLMVVWAIAGQWVKALAVRIRGADRRRRCRSGALEGRDGRPGRGRELPPGGDPALADGAAGGTGGRRRDFEYLSGFASTPFHLVNYVAPGLFHRSHALAAARLGPVSRHARGAASPTSGWSLCFLAVMAIVREFRRDRGRPAAGDPLLVITLILSLGPYVPGFRALIMLPGFSFFRAPARWSLATALALALLAGKGFDRWPEWPRPGRSLRWFVGLAVVWIVAILGLIELAVRARRRESPDRRRAKPRWPGVVGWFHRAFRGHAVDG